LRADNKLSPPRRFAWPLIDPAQVDRAIASTALLWAHEEYRQLLAAPRAKKLDLPWLNRFVRRWGVARTITSDEGSRNKMLEYLNGAFQRSIPADPGKAVDNAASEIVARGWGVKKPKGQAGRPISFASKIGFFLFPDLLVPMDGSSTDGLNRLRGIVRDGGRGRLDGKTYSTYLTAFNDAYEQYRGQIKSQCNAPWVDAVAKHFGIDGAATASVAFLRKTFDNVLMIQGGRDI